MIENKLTVLCVLIVFRFLLCPTFVYRFLPLLNFSYCFIRGVFCCNCSANRELTSSWMTNLHVTSLRTIVSCTFLFYPSYWFIIIIIISVSRVRVFSWRHADNAKNWFYIILFPLVNLNPILSLAILCKNGFELMFKILFCYIQGTSIALIFQIFHTRFLSEPPVNTL